MIQYRHDRARQTHAREIIFPQHEKLIDAIETACRIAGMSVSQFGREAVGDHKLVGDMKHHGRQPRADVKVRILMQLNRMALDATRKASARKAMAALAGRATYA